ncbi:Transposase DDE domain group 1 [Nitrosomonas communis]|uniref:Transposase DDE domain group 1 n=1 Tax=Nitrosomonas communis TaxID=44574 RepID=A0A1I4PME9_9PROT|nr:Transposase DDE domain group 1 [Nitrosomonas communis]
MRSARNGSNQLYAACGEKVRSFDEFHYATKSWKRTRRIIIKIEHADKGSNPRYVVTNLIGKPQFLYDKL